MNTKRIVCAALCLALLPSSAVSAKSDAPTLIGAPVSDGLKSIKVSVAPYNTIINGNAWDTKNALYPILTYRDVTYMPMTYDLCSELGLCIGYSQEEGLAVIREETPQYAPIAYPEGYAPFGSWHPNDLSAKYDAVTVGYPVRIEGERINARNAEYPLINFRDITYFPMIWDYTRKLCFETEWNTGSFTVNHVNGSNYLYLNAVNGTNLGFIDSVSVYETVTNEDGEEVYELSDRYYDFYNADMELATLRKLGSSRNDGDGYGYFSIPGKCEETDVNERISKAEGGILFDGKMLLSLQDALDYDVTAWMYGGENEVKVLVVDVYNYDIPAPYTPMTEYLFCDCGNGFVRVNEWSDRYSCSAVLSGKDGVYVCTRSTSPFGMARWSNDAGNVLYIEKATGKVVNLASLFPDFNAITAYGLYHGKLYVKAMYYPNYMEGSGTSYPQISVLNDGYYTVADGSFELTKLYPYVKGEVGMTDTGCFYLVPTYEFDPCVIDLLTGRSLTLDDHFTNNY